MLENDPDMEDVEDKLQAIFNQERRKQKTLKYHKVKRQMTPKGAPERKLTWDAMEQIRYLKQEQPEEWTVERLAEGFSVSPDVILRVLRSKFTAPPERKAKQDANVMAKVYQQALPLWGTPDQGRLELPGNISSAMLPAGGGSATLVTPASQSLTARDNGTGSLVNTGGTASLASLSTQDEVSFPVLRKHTSLTELSRAKEEAVYNVSQECEDDEDDEMLKEGWDGVVFTEEQLEELIVSTKPSPVTQNGREFYDSDGNFLYRI